MDDLLEELGDRLPADDRINELLMTTTVARSTTVGPTRRPKLLV